MFTRRYEVNTNAQNLELVKEQFLLCTLNDKSMIEEYINKNMLPTHIRYNSFGCSIGNSTLALEMMALSDALDIKVNIINSDITGNQIWVNFESSGKQKKVFKGIQSKEKPFKVNTQVVAIVHNGKMEQFCSLVNMRSLINQLASSPEEAAKAAKTEILGNKPLETIEQLCVAFTEGTGYKIGPQKLRCLALWIGRKSHKDIASMIGITTATVSVYIEWLKMKLRVDTRSQLFEYVIEHKLLHILEITHKLVLAQ